MNGALDIKYVKASEVKVSDIDSAALVYFLNILIMISYKCISRKLRKKLPR